LSKPVIVVFGAGGQLGQELVHRAVAYDATFRFFSHAEADIAQEADVRRILKDNSAGLVVNAAAYTNVDQAESEREQAFRGNETGPALLAKVCAEAGIPLVHISTDYVFDGRKTSAYVENDQTGPLNIYGQSKLVGEVAIARALREHVILRTSWVFGRYGRNFLKTMLRLAGERDELRVVADQRGCPTATDDLAQAILSIAPRLIAREAVFGVYHFASPFPATWHDFACEIIEAQHAWTGRRPNVLPIRTEDYPVKAERPRNSELDCSKFVSAFGFKAQDWRIRTREIVASLCAGAEKA
jgi:dTDP-4-dehydrorhamnose reductase